MVARGQQLCAQPLDHAHHNTALKRSVERCCRKMLKLTDLEWRVGGVILSALSGRRL
jgi:hypothetical protein